MGLRSWIYKKTGLKLRKFSYDYKKIKYSQFESIGDNCEFGLFLKRNRNDISSFFKWTLIHDYELISKLILNDFKDIFLFENLKPFSPPDLIFDEQYKICFHSDMKVKYSNGSHFFEQSEIERKNIYIKEKQKIEYLKNKFNENIKNKQQIYVVKKNDITNDKSIFSFCDILVSKSKSKVLVVKTTKNKNNLFKVEKIKDRVYVGYIDRFSDYNKVESELRYESWGKLMESASRKLL